MPNQRKGQIARELRQHTAYLNTEARKRLTHEQQIQALDKRPGRSHKEILILRKRIKEHLAQGRTDESNKEELLLEENTNS